MRERRVVVSGMGIVSPFGLGVKTFWDNISQGNSAASLITDFDVSSMSTKFAASLPLKDDELASFIENKKTLKTMNRAGRFAVIAAKEAMQDSDLNTVDINPYRMGTSLGASGLGLWDLAYSNQTFQIFAEAIRNIDSARIAQANVWRDTLERVNPLTPLKALPNIPTAHLAIEYNARGNCQTICTACTSSAQAIGEAYRQIKYDIEDVMITGGSDAMINPNGLVAFSMVGVMSKNNREYQSAARPFDRRRDGFMLGEGAAIFILEEMEHCKRRGAAPYGEVVGYASTCDAFRLTDEPPDAWGSVAAMKLALNDARLNPAEIDYINAHGTGTPMNDKTETFAIKKVFKEKSPAIPISSTKSMIGHLVAAAGAVEFATCVLALEKQAIPPTINYREADPECDLDYVANHTREARLNAILSNSFGFGGQNACLILKKFT